MDKLFVNLFIAVALSFTQVCTATGTEPDADISGSWSGTQQGRYEVKATFYIEHNTSTGIVHGTARFVNTERPVTADAEIREGKLYKNDKRVFVDLLVYYKTGLQADTDVNFQLELVTEETLMGSGENDWGTHLQLNLTRETDSKADTIQ